MKTLTEYINALAIDKLRHRVLGEYINPAIFFLTAPFLYGLDFWLQLNIFKWLLVPVALSLCYLFHWAIELHQRRTQTGNFELEDAKAGFASAKLITPLVLIIQLLNIL